MCLSLIMAVGLESGEASPAENDEVRNDQYEWQHVDFDPNIGVGLLPPVPIPMSNAAESSRKYNSYAAELVRRQREYNRARGGQILRCDRCEAVGLSVNETHLVGVHWKCRSYHRITSSTRHAGVNDMVGVPCQIAQLK
ncbi:hypothetical protein PBRA_009255 [Plasmodiophora brassicae]|uniref:C2H2-type domain-containing protein n=1 Tax=Plasmodiophora brassicae TaxID=37360 RepID=A0A0G4J683_PLABS|nr:hypothetical protein PBRA_009255 [Plasmodiophora brassicae]